MSGGYRGKPPTDNAALMRRINELEDQIKRLSTRRSTAAVVTATAVVEADPSGVLWRLGVSTSGATTWTRVDAM